MQTHSSSKAEKLLSEIGVLSDKVRALRATGAAGHAAQIKSLEAESRHKWEELRSLRADPNAGELPSPRLGGLYR